LYRPGIANVHHDAGTLGSSASKDPPYGLWERDGSKEELVIVGSRDVIDRPGLWLGPVGDVGCSRGEVGGEGGSWRANAIGDGQPSLASRLYRRHFGTCHPVKKTHEVPSSLSSG
jgi:hypothetical protein